MGKILKVQKGTVTVLRAVEFILLAVTSHIDQLHSCLCRVAFLSLASVWLSQ